MSTELQGLLDGWDIQADQIVPLTERENRIYRIESSKGRFVLKIARKDYQSQAALESEIALLRYLKESNFATSCPLANQNGDYLIHSKFGFVSIQHWIEGEPFGQSGGTLPRSTEDFAALGRKLAQFHELLKNWPRPSRFERPSWGVEGLVGEGPVWGRFWDNPKLDHEARQCLSDFRDYARGTYPPDESQIIHADLVPENILASPRGLVFIDFDDFGFGHTLFDIATALLKNDHHRQFEEWKAALIEGYISLRPLNLAQLDLFMALRSVSYIGWVATRPDLDPEGARTRRYFLHARQYISRLGVFS